MDKSNHKVDWYAALEEILGHRPKYYMTLTPTGAGDGNLGTLLSIVLEIEKSVRVVSEGVGCLSHKRIRKECIAEGFDVDRMIEDAIRSGASDRKIKALHMMSGDSIKRIADRIGEVRLPGNFLKGLTDETVLRTYQDNGKDASKTARILGISRTTVAAILARARKKKPIND